LKALISIKTGDVFDGKAANGDLEKLRDSQRFTSVEMKKHSGERGGVVVPFVVTERP
jgi:hypothetical protein